MINSWEDIWQPIDDQLRRYCQARIPQQDVADVVQDVWMRLVKAKPIGLPLNPDIARYAMGIAKHVVADYWRTHQALPTDLDRTVQVDAQSPDEALIRNEFNDSIRNLMDKLPTEIRPLIQDQLFGHATLETLAARYQLPLGTVKSRLYRARHLLQQHILTLPTNEYATPFRGREWGASPTLQEISRWLVPEKPGPIIGLVLRLLPDGAVWLDMHLELKRPYPSPTAPVIGWDQLGDPRRVRFRQPHITLTPHKSLETPWSTYQVTGMTRTATIDLGFYLSAPKAQTMGITTPSRSGSRVSMEINSATQGPSKAVTARLAVVLPQGWRVRPIRPIPDHIVPDGDSQYVMYSCGVSQDRFIATLDAKP